MSEIKSRMENPAINGPEDIAGYYTGALENPRLNENISKMGIELEFNFYDSKTLAPLTIKQSEKIIAEGKKSGIPVHHEPSATTLETISAPFAPDKLENLIEQAQERFSKLVKAARKNNAFPSVFGVLPHIKPEDHNLVVNERYRAFWVPPREDMQGIFESFLSPNIQTSVSYRDYDHLLRIVRLCVVLEPLIFLSTDSSGKFYNNKPVDFCPRFKTHETRGRNGGIPDFYFTARTGGELINGHIDHTLNHPHIFACFDFEGNLKRLPNKEWASFMELEEKDYGPRDFLNYRQAQSESWRRCSNIAEIHDDDGNVFAHRAEMSGPFATGLQHQRITALLLTNLIAYSDVFYERVTALLKEAGIDINALDESREVLEHDYKAATYHNGRFHDLPFGSKTVKDVAMPLADIIEESYSAQPALNRYLKPILHILRSGRPDWVVHREVFSTPGDVRLYLEQLPALVQEDPGLISAENCADFTASRLKKLLAA